MGRTFIILFVVAIIGTQSIFRIVYSASMHRDALMAVYTYNFAKFISWPESSFGGSDAPLYFCLFGEHPFGVDTLALLGEKKVLNHPIVIRLFPRVGMLRECHIVFIGKSEDMRIKSIIAELSKLPILTVSDIPGFSDMGGIITFVTERQRLRFDINTGSANQAGLKFSSKLLEVARKILKPLTADVQ